MRPQTRAMLWLLATGLAVGFVRVWLGGAEGGVADLVGCVMSGGALFGVIAMRWLAAEVDRAQVADDGLAALALCAWLVASVPPSPASNDEFVHVYAPASLVAVTGLLGWASVRPALTLRRLLIRHAVLLTVTAPLTAVLSGEDAVRRGGAAAAAWGVVAIGLTMRRWGEQAQGLRSEALRSGQAPSKKSSG